MQDCSTMMLAVTQGCSTMTSAVMQAGHRTSGRQHDDVNSDANRAQDGRPMTSVVDVGRTQDARAAPLSSIAMAALAGVRETSMARNNATNVELQLGAL
ncbi:unnamed protein product [Sphagnum balticum]